MRYRIAEGVDLKEQGQESFLVSLRPLRMVRLNTALLVLLHQMDSDWYTPQSDIESRALETLAKRGLLIRQWPVLEPSVQQPTVSIIIPVKDRAEDLRNCLNSLHKLSYPQDHLDIIVVDDGSKDETPEVAKELGARLLSSGAVGGGPALARNTGARAATGEILAFIDSDCTASEEWLNELLPVFVEKQVAAVGGWVDGMHKDTALDCYEAVMSSLNLGTRELSGEAGDDTFYLPSCNLLVRKDAFLAAGCFRTELQVGEDVDLTWRLRDAGWKIVYLPRGKVFHAHRSRLWPFMKRRFEYGTSEGILQQLHPVRGKKMLVPTMLAIILLSMTASLIFQSLMPVMLAAVFFFADTVWNKRKMNNQALNFPWTMIVSARFRALGSLGYYIGYHLLRYYLLPALVAAMLYPPLMILLVVALSGVGYVDFRVRKAQLPLLWYYQFYILEQASYGAGVFWGCLKMKDFSTYRLDLNGANFTA
ncbi:MAG: mycofactocin biosynthesis glycosyltransferase MftF [Deltaproteobacteria bacterium]|nr:mycofactocin biosynthesis glycosyltransferase MftF [Deltaproteobacteria bacterium]